MGAKIEKIAYIINDGPNREELFDAFRYSRNKEVIFPIHFTLLKNNSDPTHSECKTRNARITGIDYDGEEDGDGYSFVIRGKLDVHFCSEGLYCDNLRANYETCRFEACYNTQTHRGRMMIQLFHL